MSSDRNHASTNHFFRHLVVLNILVKAAQIHPFDFFVICPKWRLQSHYMICKWRSIRFSCTISYRLNTLVEVWAKLCFFFCEVGSIMRKKNPPQKENRQPFSMNFTDQQNKWEVTKRCFPPQKWQKIYKVYQFLLSSFQIPLFSQLWTHF